MSKWLQIVGVYRIYDTVNQRSYIGSSDHCDRRLRRNRHNLINGTHNNHPLQEAWDLHGSERFEFEIVEMTSEEDRISREQYWIDDLRNKGVEVFNLHTARGTRKGCPQPAYVGEIIRARMTGIPKTAEHRTKISAARKGQKKSPEHKEKLRLAAIRQFSDPEARAKAAEYGARARRKLVTPTGEPWYVFSVYRDRLRQKNLSQERYEMILSWIKTYVYRS